MIADLEAEYLAAAEELRAARYAQATEFVRFKGAGHAVSAAQATQQAIVETESALDVATARADVARLRLERASHGGMSAE